MPQRIPCNEFVAFNSIHLLCHLHSKNMFSSFCFNPVENEKQCSAIDLFRSHFLHCPKLECGLRVAPAGIARHFEVALPIRELSHWVSLKQLHVHLLEAIRSSHMIYHEWYVYTIYTYRLYVDIFGYCYIPMTNKLHNKINNQTQLGLHVASSRRSCCWFKCLPLL